MYMWRRFDIGEIREDAARMKALHMRVVRFFLEWEAFQPEADRIDSNALDHLAQMMDAFGNAGLETMPTLFTGHMSGCNYLPAWSLDRNVPHGRFRTMTHAGESPYGIGDFYADDRLLAAQERFCTEVSRAVGTHPSLYAWDLGNEFSNLAIPKRPQDGATWSARLTQALQGASSAPVTGGNHGEDVEQDRNIRLSSMSQPWGLQTMHGYSVYSTFSRGRLDTDVVPFYLRLAQAFSGKDVLFSEFGNPTCPPGTVSPYDREPLPGEPSVDRAHVPQNSAPYACLTEDEMARYGDDVIHKLHASGAIGALWWCWADYAEALYSEPPFDKAIHERHFGIIRKDGSVKPIAQVLADWGKRGAQTLPAPAAIDDEAAFYAALPKRLHEDYERYTSTR